MLKRLLASARRRVRALARRVLGPTPEPPLRLREEVEVRLLASPAWGPAEWIAWAAELADGAWRDGYAAGSDDALRARLGHAPSDPALRRRSVWDSPTMAEVRRRRGDLSDPFAGVPEEERAAFLEALALRSDGFRVVVERAPDGSLPTLEASRRGDGR